MFLYLFAEHVFLHHLILHACSQKVTTSEKELDNLPSKHCNISMT